MNKAEAYLQLAALLAGGCVGVLAVGAVSAALGNQALAELLTYGGGLLLVSVAVLVGLGLFTRR